MKVICINDNGQIGYAVKVKFGEIYTVARETSCCGKDSYCLFEFPNTFGEIVCKDCGSDQNIEHLPFYKHRFQPIDDPETRKAYEDLERNDKIRKALRELAIIRNK
jgi:hypothetical protein